ncbi:MAG: N-formylglutamate amidohydrolase [Prevotella sp.]|nr:N-formylglutamate amidohydrolase [Prevotella sp.]
MEKKKGFIWRDGLLSEILNCYDSVLLHVPHSSTKFPEGSGYSFEDLDEEERLLIDYDTDVLFAPEEESERVRMVVFPYCRLYCDVERLIHDPLEKEGLGISYGRWKKQEKSQNLIWRSFSSLQEAFGLYADFHAMVAKKIVEMKGKRLLIDCHSFSSKPNLLNANPPDIDICIGFNDDETCPERKVIEMIAQHFRKRGYKVGINTPFSNSKTFEVPVDYHSVMIEVNKRKYL